MSLRKRVGMVLVWVVSLVAAWSLGYAQVPQGQRPSKFPLFSGRDFGFRVDQMKMDPATGVIEGSPTGTFVVRINGSWYEAHQGPK